MSQHPAKRLVQPNRKEEKATCQRAPWILLWLATKPNRSEAKRLEGKLKNLSRERLIRNMLKFHQQVQGPDKWLLL